MPGPTRTTRQSISITSSSPRSTRRVNEVGLDNVVEFAVNIVGSSVRAESYHRTHFVATGSRRMICPSPKQAGDADKFTDSHKGDCRMKTPKQSAVIVV